MIANRDLHLELDGIEKVIMDEQDAYKRATLKAMSLQIKLLSNLRTNMVTIMKFMNVPMKKAVDIQEKKND